MSLTSNKHDAFVASHTCTVTNKLAVNS